MSVCWRPPRGSYQSSKLGRFAEHVQSKYGERFQNYFALHKWSVKHLEEFWEAFWDFSGIEVSQEYTQVIEDKSVFPGTVWFPNARLNAAQTLMRFCFVDHLKDVVALRCCDEEHRTSVTYSQLLRDVHLFQRHLVTLGVECGDRVAGVVSNAHLSCVAMLASVSLGAVWTSCSPDFGTRTIVDRLEQVKPKVLVCCAEYRFRGKLHTVWDKIAGVCNQVPSIQNVIVNALPENSNLAGLPPVETFSNILNGILPETEMEFVQVSFSHPVYMVFTSGTTGKPKCIVQGYGVVLNHLKELTLHCDIGVGDTVLYFTTCAWMMWNWLMSGLACGCTIVLVDACPLYPTTSSLLRLAIEEGVTVFGTSARYLELCRENDIQVVITKPIEHSPTSADSTNLSDDSGGNAADDDAPLHNAPFSTPNGFNTPTSTSVHKGQNSSGATPLDDAKAISNNNNSATNENSVLLQNGNRHDVANSSRIFVNGSIKIRTVLSTGSPLAAREFEYVTQSCFKDMNVQISSISGGSDINGCWVLGCPLLPVHSGEIQCKGLGHDVAVFNESGLSVLDQRGELVVLQPTPSMPLCFWNDPDGTLFRDAYFSKYPGVWCHSDYAQINSRTGGIIISGRSDATLNVHGVRLGTAEVYRALEGLPAITDSVVVEQRLPNETTRLVLFVVLAPDNVLDENLKAAINSSIRQNLCARHVPGVIKQVPQIPYTANGKKMELAVRCIVNGLTVTNQTAVSNPDCLPHFVLGDS